MRPARLDWCSHKINKGKNDNLHQQITVTPNFWARVLNGLKKIYMEMAFDVAYIIPPEIILLYISYIRLCHTHACNVQSYSNNALL